MNAAGNDMDAQNVVRNSVAPTVPSDRGSVRWRRIFRSRPFAIAVTAGALLIGYLIARKLGVGNGTLSTVGVVALVIGSHVFMHGGHGGHGGHEGHSAQRSARRTGEPQDGEKDSAEEGENPEDRDRPYSPRGSAGCH